MASAIWIGNDNISDGKYAYLIGRIEAENEAENIVLI